MIENRSILGRYRDSSAKAMQPDTAPRTLHRIPVPIRHGFLKHQKCKQSTEENTQKYRLTGSKIHSRVNLRGSKQHTTFSRRLQVWGFCTETLEIQETHEHTSALVNTTLVAEEQDQEVATLNPLAGRGHTRSERDLQQPSPPTCPMLPMVRIELL